MNTIRNCAALSLALLAALPLTAVAEQPTQPLGAETQAWLDLQAKGQQASKTPRPVPGEIADNVYQRYVDSFKLPIPAEFKRQSTTESNNGSSGQ